MRRKIFIVLCLSAFSHDVTINGHELRVSAAISEPVWIYGAAGQPVARGLTGECIPVPGRGVYFLVTPTYSTKIIL